MVLQHAINRDDTSLTYRAPKEKTACRRRIGINPALPVYMPNSPDLKAVIRMKTGT